MNILESLWMGNISPIERPIVPGSQYHQTLHRTIEAEEQLKSTAPPQQKKVLQIYSELEAELQGVAEYEAFSIGFRLGMQLLLAGLEIKKSSENHWFSELLVEISGIEPLTS